MLFLLHQQATPTSTIFFPKLSFCQKTISSMGHTLTNKPGTCLKTKAPETGRKMRRCIPFIASPYENTRLHIFTNLFWMCETIHTVSYCFKIQRECRHTSLNKGWWAIFLALPKFKQRCNVGVKNFCNFVSYSVLSYFTIPHFLNMINYRGTLRY